MAYSAITAFLSQIGLEVIEDGVLTTNDFRLVAGQKFRPDEVKDLANHIRHNPWAADPYKGVNCLRSISWVGTGSDPSKMYNVIYLNFDTGDGELSLLIDVLDVDDDGTWSKDEVENALRMASAIEKALRVGSRLFDLLGSGGGLG